MFRAMIERVSSVCAVCHAWPSQPVCAGCLARFSGPQHRCQRCAIEVPAGATVCGECLRSPPPLAACMAAFDYAYPWSGLIASFKFGAQPGWAGLFASQLQRTPGVTAALNAASLVLAMPLSATRLRERGFNQALQIARALAPDKVDSTLLLRVRDTAPQPGLLRHARQRNVANAFAVDPMRTGEVRGARVVLVDDVMTSGASLHSAATALTDAGAAAVAAVVVARTPAPHDT